MKEGEYPLVSIVMPSYNQARYLEMAIRSVLEQGYPQLELILMDGGSTDGSVDIIQRYQDRLAFWISEPDAGQTFAINAGLQRAKGEILAWLNSDDAYLPGAIQQAVDALTSHPELGMVYGDGLMVDTGEVLLDRHTYPQVDALDLLCFEVILQPATFMRRSALETIGYLNEAYDLIMDHELWIRIAKKHPVLHCPSFWAIERTHPSAKTIAKAGAFVREAERLIDWARSDPDLQPLFVHSGKRVLAGLEVFAARRLIDAGEPSSAFRKFLRGARLDPAFVLRYWYKVVQAGFSAIGLSWAFMGYRRLRRRVLFRRRRVEVIRDN